MIHACSHCHKQISSKLERCPYCKAVNELNVKHAPRRPTLVGLFRQPALTGRK